MGTSPANADRRVALVVGNAGYIHTPGLENPINDARDVASALGELGFQVILGTNLDKRGFEQKIREFAKTLAGADVGLFFYSGHGLQVNGQNYLVAIDAKLEAERDLDFEATQVDFVLRNMEREVKTNIVFLDACRNNPLARNLARSMGTRAAAIDRGFAPLASGLGTFVAFATQPGAVAADGSGRNSPFTAALTKYVRTPGLSLTDLMVEVRREVVVASNGAQVPWDHSALQGRFFFKPAVETERHQVAINTTPATKPVGPVTVKAVMHSDLKILDPIWTTAYIVRDHGYMIYDTLFSMDAAGEIKPQMLEGYALSADKLTYTLTLREGLLWHDGQPVTAEDCVASIKRWGAKDTMGQKLLASVQSLSAKDSKTIEIRLKEPSGLVLLALGKPSSIVPFMMPKRVAETDPNTQISDFTGSGPFVFKREEWKPGDKTVYVKFEQYRPRNEPPFGLAGGKMVRVDRVEWHAISDHAVAMRALLDGQIDMLEAPQHDLIPTLKADKNVTVFSANQLGNQYTMRLNWLAKPFDNPKVRRAVWYALNQEDFLKSVFGDASFYKVCHSFYACGTVLASEAGMEGLLTSNFKKSKELLKEAGYDGTPIVLLHATDLTLLANLAPAAKSLLEKGGFTVDMQSMDWQTLVARRAKKDPPNAGGWHAFATSWLTSDLLNPVMMSFLNASCDKALFGWPCDAEVERLRDQFAREPNPLRQRSIAEAIQIRAAQVTTHIPLGQWFAPSAWRRDIDGVVIAPVPVFWGISKR
jgi:peptide/nickel transport system substrate-binding protein